MKLECPVCFNLLSEEPDLKLKVDPDGNAPRVKKRRCSDDNTDSPVTSSSQRPGSAELAVTKCGHLFHKGCLLSWFATNLSCPTCRKPAPDGIEGLRNVFLPTPDGNDSQILYRNTTGELELAKIRLESFVEKNESLAEQNEMLAEEIESLRTQIKTLSNATAVKDRCSKKLQNEKDMMELCTNKLRDRYQRLWSQLTELRKNHDLLKMRASELETEVAKLKRSSLKAARGRRGRGAGSPNSTSSSNSIILIDLTDD